MTPKLIETIKSFKVELVAGILMTNHTDLHWIMIKTTPVIFGNNVVTRLSISPRSQCLLCFEICFCRANFINWILNNTNSVTELLHSLLQSCHERCLSIIRHKAEVFLYILLHSLNIIISTHWLRSNHLHWQHCGQLV